jgi:hypothetical protein
MSAMPARVTELSEGIRPTASPPVVVRRGDRRAALKEARRQRRHLTILSCSVLGASFALTVGILDVLH